MTTKSNQFDFSVNKGHFFIISLGIILFFTGNVFIPSLSPNSMSIWIMSLEHFQSLFLFFMILYTVNYTRKVKTYSNLYKFWLWTAFWWLMIFGRGISWGRDFFPDVPRFYYKIIATILIAIPILSMFLISSIRKEIVRRFKNEKIPVWFIVLAFAFLGLADIAEHNRIGHDYLVYSSDYDDLIEELMEIPCFISLSFIVFYLQKNEQKRLSKKC